MWRRAPGGPLDFIGPQCGGGGRQDPRRTAPPVRGSPVGRSAPACHRRRPNGGRPARTREQLSRNRSRTGWWAPSGVRVSDEGVRDGEGVLCRAGVAAGPRGTGRAPRPPPPADEGRRPPPVAWPDIAGTYSTESAPCELTGSVHAGADGSGRSRYGPAHGRQTGDRPWPAAGRGRSVRTSPRRGFIATL